MGTFIRRALSIGVALGAFGLAGSVASAESDTLCGASIAFDPPRAILGQQVVLRVRVHREDSVTKSEWIEPAALADARVEHLPDWNGEERAPGSALRYQVREERRALFPKRAGEFHVPPSIVRCTLNADGAPPFRDFAVPGATLEVVEVPRTGRPDDFVGTIGPIAVQSLAVPQQIALGEVVRLAVMVRGHGDLWNLADPLPEIPTAEIFRRRPELTIETGPLLSIVRHFAYDVVPGREGELVVPGIRLRTFNPIDRRFELETTEDIRIAVGARRTRTPAATDHPAESGVHGPATERAGGNGGASWIVWAGAGAIPLCVGAGWVWNVVRRKRRQRESFEIALEKELLSHARPDALAKILRARIQSQIPGIESMSAEEIASSPHLSGRWCELAGILARIERARFDPHAETPERAEILGAVKRL